MAAPRLWKFARRERCSHFRRTDFLLNFSKQASTARDFISRITVEERVETIWRVVAALASILDLVCDGRRLVSSQVYFRTNRKSRLKVRLRTVSDMVPIDYWRENRMNSVDDSLELGFCARTKIDFALIRTEPGPPKMAEAPFPVATRTAACIPHDIVVAFME